MKAKQAPIRTCIACRQRHNQSELIRIRAGNGLTGTADSRAGFGRSAYLCRDEKCIEKGLRKAVLTRSLKVALTDEEIVRIKENL